MNNWGFHLETLEGFILRTRATRNRPHFPKSKAQLLLTSITAWSNSFPEAIINPLEQSCPRQPSMMMQMFYIYASNGFPQWLGSKESACNAGVTGDGGLIPGWRRSPGGGRGNPLQCSCLEKPMDRGAWWIIVHQVAKSQTRLKQLSMHASNEVATSHMWLLSTWNETSMTKQKCNFTNFNSNKFKLRRPHVLLDSVALEEDNVLVTQIISIIFSHSMSTFNQKIARHVRI